MGEDSPQPSEKVKVVYSVLSKTELRETLEFISERSPEAALKLHRRVRSTVAALARRDFEGPKYVLSNGEVVHTWPTPPLKIIYQRAEDILLVVRIRHHAQEPL